MVNNEKRRPACRTALSKLPKNRGLPRLRRRTRQQAFTLSALAGQLTGAAHSFRALTRTLFGGLFVMVPALHLAERAFTLHLLL